jgi:hypothetical protein
MNRLNRIATGFLFLLILCASGLFAQSQTISIQGTLKDANGASVADGMQTATFRLYDALTNGTVRWQETAAVTVVGGIYSHSLGKTTPLIASIFVSTVYLSVEVGGLELSPRTEMTYAPYAISVNSAQRIAQGGCSGQVGDLKYSILPPAQFAAQNGTCWVPMDGRAIPGTTLAAVMGIGNVPNMSGLFLRATEYNGDQDPGRAHNAAPSLQTDGYSYHGHTVNLNTTSAGEHSHDFFNRNWIYDPALATHGMFNTPNAPGYIPLRDFGNNSSTNPAGAHTHQVNGATGGAGGAETRPKNMNFFIYIRVD